MHRFLEIRTTIANPKCYGLSSPPSRVNHPDANIFPLAVILRDNNAISRLQKNILFQITLQNCVIVNNKFRYLLPLASAYSDITAISKWTQTTGTGKKLNQRIVS